jgi:hypothetical protein
MGIIYCDNETQDKTHCDFCAERLLFPCWGYQFFHINSEHDKEGEVTHHEPFIVITCFNCASELAHIIISDILLARNKYSKAFQMLESIPTMKPESVVKIKTTKNN